MFSTGKFLLISNQLIAISLLTLAIINCSGGGGEMEANKRNLPSIKEVSTENWQRLSQKKIYFGHQSVGSNIIDGMKEVLTRQTQIRLKITTDSGEFDKPSFAHSAIGKNENPESKCLHFSELMHNGLGEKMDIALFKFCFVDVTAKTDVAKLFAQYKSTMQELKQTYPSVSLVYVTVPLMTVQTGPRAWVKKMIGRPIDGYEDNIRREEFNSMLRKEYQGKEHFFDLAAIESIFPDGSQAVFKKNGKSFPRLPADYSTDGGHLNELGRKHVAEQFLVFLATL